MLSQAERQALSPGWGNCNRLDWTRSKPPSQGSMAGFTLLEILVAVAVLGILLVSLTQGSRLVLFAWDRHGRLIDQDADLDAVDRVLRSLIERAKPGSKWEPLAFVGNARSVAFTTILPVSAGPFSTQRADVALGVDASHRLLLVWTPHLHAIRIGRPPEASTTEILQGVERLEFSYRPATQGDSWTSVWHDSVPPRLVRVQIVFSDPNRPPWPDIVAAPRLDAP